jgi:hypothetical protein
MAELDAWHLFVVVKVINRIEVKEYRRFCMRLIKSELEEV